MGLLAAVVSLGCVGAPAHAVEAAPSAASAPVAAAKQASPLSVRLEVISPTVATPGDPVSVRVKVTNGTTAALAGVRVEARLGQAGSLLTRKQVADQATSQTVRRDDQVVAGNTLATALAAHETRAVDLTLPGASIRPSRSYGVLPLTFTAQAGATSATSATFLPFQGRKEYEPLTLAFAAPLTLDPDPALVSGSAEAVRAAWLKQVGGSGRIARILEATRSAPVTWAVDPSIVGAGTAGSTPASGTAGATPSPTATATAGSGDDPVLVAQRELAQVIRAGAATHPVWELPTGDPDLAALTRLGVAGGDLASVVGASSTLASVLGGSSAPARIAWPVGTPPSATALDSIRQAYGGAGPAAVITPSTSVDADPDITGRSVRRTPGGQPLLAYDATLSSLFATADDADRAPELAQRFLAETMALLEESPGRARTVLVAAPRGFDPDPTATQAIFGAVTAAPWLQTTSTGTLLQAATSADVTTAQPSVDAKDPLSPGESPLTVTGVRRIVDAYATVAGLAQVLSAATGSATLPDSATLSALLSTRWRSAPTAWSPLADDIHQRIDDLSTGVTVQPSTMNFFAEHGVVQVTVINNLDVEVHDVRLVLDPQGQPPRLRVTQPAPPLTIRPNSRVSVRVGVDAVAAGVVPVVAHLATPSGTRLGTDATVRMRVQPTNGWLLLAIGGLAGVVFLAGLYRALRAGSPRVSSADLKDIDLQ